MGGKSKVPISLYQVKSFPIFYPIWSDQNWQIQSILRLYVHIY